MKIKIKICPVEEERIEKYIYIIIITTVFKNERKYSLPVIGMFRVVGFRVIIFSSCLFLKIYSM